jgi:phosphoglycerol transferase
MTGLRQSTLPPGIVARLTAWCLPPCFVFVVSWLALGGSSREWSVPLSFSGDGLFYLAQTRATIDHGWWWTNPSLAAPFVFQALLFPQNTNVDQAIIWLMSRFISEVGLVQNAAFLVFLSAGAISARWCLRQLGVSEVAACAAAVLFAICPFVLYRNVVHFALMVYLVPFPATAAILLASGQMSRLTPRRLAVIAVGCFLIGLNYVYFPFFGCILVVAGTLVGLGRSRSAAPLKAGACLLAVLVVATALNLAPNFVAWQRFGRLDNIRHNAGEAELYGLKIRHLITPVSAYGLPPLERWLRNEDDAWFPLENENARSRLGLAATTGFLGLIGTLVFPVGVRRRSDDDLIPAAAAMALAAVLVATIGGFASIFSVLVSPEVRGYNRIAPFISFFALAGLALWVDRVTASRNRAWRVCIWLAFVGCGVFDERQIMRSIARYDADITQTFRQIGAFVGDLEARLPEGAMVFQLPIRPFPADGGIERMDVYDHFQPYLVSRNKFRWSSGTMTQEGLAWEKRIEALPAEALPSHLRREGFSIVLINRDGYADRGEQIARALSRAPDGARLLRENVDFFALDLRPAAQSPRP